jgi:hypothetical protein
MYCGPLEWYSWKLLRKLVEPSRQSSATTQTTWIGSYHHISQARPRILSAKQASEYFAIIASPY